MSTDDFRRCIVSVPSDDHHLAGLVGVEIPAARATYRLGRRIATGSTSSAFFGTRRSAEGDLSVVVKVTLPAVLNAAGAAAALAIRKEAVSLGRLSAVAWPNPFVIRLLDAGEIDLEGGGARTALPWIALEYVHGGADGTTLGERVERTIVATGHAFDLRRVERAIRALTSGLGAIHALRVIHRDISPEHVLCCGRGDAEIFKIAEFGFARALGMKETFGRMKLGRPGYAAPEQNGDDPSKVGPWSDVHALAATIYFLVSGRHYAKSIDPLAAFRGERAGDKSLLLESPALHPELRARAGSCHALDRVLTDAMAASPERRTRSADVLAARLLGALHLEPRTLGRPRPPKRAPASPPDPDRLHWSVVARPRADLAVRKAAWSSDGRALAITDRGCAFWDATRWIDAGPKGGASRSVLPMGAGQWLLAGDGPMLQRFDGVTSTDVHELPFESTQGSLRLEHASGDLDDLAVFAFADAGRGSPVLHASSGGRWLAAFPLVDVDVVTALARIGDSRWLVAGRARDGFGYLGVYEPLSFRVDRLPTPGAPTFLAAAGLASEGIGLACGLGGTIAWFDGARLVATSSLPDPVPLAAAAFDGSGRAWVASAGAIWCTDGRGWRRVWWDAQFQAPFCSLYADDGRVLSMSVDGGVVEGRAVD